jgi:Flp pilus assembly protein TadG
MMQTNFDEPGQGARARTTRRRSGMAMVEFVMVLPTLLVLLFGMLEFGVIFYQFQTLSNAAREGARESIVYRTNCDATAIETLVENTVITYAASANITVASGDIQITGLCTGAGTPADVRVTHDYSFKVLPNFVAAISPDITLVGRSNMRNEGNS